MNNRAYSFAALLAVVGVSIVFGMILGGKLNAPPVALAAPQTAGQATAAPIRLAPAVTGEGGLPDFADIVEQSLPAVVGVTNTQVVSLESRKELRERFRDDPFFRWFFGDPDERDGDRPREMPRLGFGSGFIVSPDGYILTNNHVVADSKRIVVRTQGNREYEATVIGTDPAIDLALIKIEPEGQALPALPLGNSESLRVGQWVIAIGNPLEFEQTVTVGVVSAKYRQVPIGDTDISLTQFIQTDAAINFGNSGGPLLDGAGNVIGINTAIRRGNLAEGIGFALPINDAREAMEQLLRSGRVERGFLGIVLSERGVSDVAAEYYGLPDSNGAIVQEVTPGQPAYNAGLRPGDVIRKVDGKVVRDNRDLIQKISAHRAGDRVALEVFREGKTVSRTAHLMERTEGLAARNAAGGEEEQSPEREETAEASGLGVTVENLTPSIRSRLDVEDDVAGVLVVGVDYDSPLADAGVGPNVIITTINEKLVNDVSAWNRVVDKLEPGAAVRIELLAGAQHRYVFLRVPER